MPKNIKQRFELIRVIKRAMATSTIGGTGTDSSVVALTVQPSLSTLNSELPLVPSEAASSDPQSNTSTAKANGDKHGRRGRPSMSPDIRELFSRCAQPALLSQRAQVLWQSVTDRTASPRGPACVVGAVGRGRVVGCWAGPSQQAGRLRLPADIIGTSRMLGPAQATVVPGNQAPAEKVPPQGRLGDPHSGALDHPGHRDFRIGALGAGAHSVEVRGPVEWGTQDVWTLIYPPLAFGAVTARGAADAHHKRLPPMTSTSNRLLAPPP